MTVHNSHLTRAAAALLASGATFHIKDAGDPMETLKKAFGEHNVEVLRRLGATDGKLEELGTRLFDLEQKGARSRSYGGRDAVETWGSQISVCEEVRGINSNWRGRVRMDVKASTITSSTADAAGSAGSLVSPDRQSGYIDLPRRKLRVRALFSPGKTSGNAVEWPMLKARTNNAAIAPENTLKAQSDLQFDLKQWPVRTIAHWMLASKQILDDVPALGSVIDGELRYGLADVEDFQFLMGSATGDNLQGVYTGATAFAAPFAITSPTMIDMLLQAIAQVDETEHETDGIVLNPIDWRLIQSIKDSEGRYIGGGPFGDLVQRLWQMPIVTSKAMTRDKFLVGAFKQGAQIFDREEATVEISTEDSDNFRKNLVTLRGEERLAFVVKYPGAFVKGDFGNVT
ncbi:phage major capsid protein [Ensifer adhaerens]|uniref:phage major capsid protein n=1 Tax=Ensifer adhaerens TaxID=106592 RepID=UPI000FD8C23C|nr:phage major capsid protein [Ensifer adhaerens]MDF8353219.1 phage major capsid protein [Ensifer adhaerens]THA67981.1 phage major capsid protein [Ensifer adhaerens]